MMHPESSPARRFSKSTAAATDQLPAETGLGWRAFTRAYNADRMGFLTALPTVGPVVRMAANLVFVSDPALIETIFRRTNTDFRMTMNRRLESVDAARGDAALEAWMAARRHTSTALGRPVIDGADTSSAELRQLVDGWVAAPEPARVVEDLTRLNLRASVRRVVGWADPDLEDSVCALMESLGAVVNDGTRLPGALALLQRRHRRARRADDAIRAQVSDLITSGGATAGGGLVGQLAAAEQDLDTVANLAVAVLLAGTLVPAAAGAWTLALMLAHPEWLDRLRDDRTARGWAINEALRLYPPTWLISRTVAADGIYAGWRLRAGDELVVSPYVSQRDPRVFQQPDQFRPERWADLRPGIAEYFPFGAGARRCVAAELALRQLNQLVYQVSLHSAGLSGTFPRSASTITTLFPADLRIEFTGWT